MSVYGQFFVWITLTAICAVVTCMAWFTCFFILPGDRHAGTSVMCPDGRLANPPLREWLFPLKTECLYADGRVVDLTPGFANPLVGGLSGLTLLGVLQTGRTVWKTGDQDGPW